MMKVSEFADHFPQFAFNFNHQLRDQPRIFEGAALDQFPSELEPEHAYQAGSRGRPNPNQTRAHSQCATCLRVLRNDFFYTVPSMMRRNVVFSHCRECNQQHNAQRHETRIEKVHARRQVLWNFLAPRCAACGFDQHFSALELHHAANKEALVGELVTQVTLAPTAGRIEALLREAAGCMPLCCNCHRMYHAEALKLPAYPRPKYAIAELMRRLKESDT
jgi:hypothetical protein